MMRWRLCALAALMIGAGTPATASEPASAAASPRPAESFAALPFLEGPKLSPDGTKMAAKIAVNDQQYFAIIPLDDFTKPRLVPATGKDINWWNWVNNDWLVVGIGHLEHLIDDDFYVRRVVGISADATKINPIAFQDAGQNADDVLWYATDGSPKLLLSLQTSIYYDHEGFFPEVDEVDVSTGKTKRLLRPYQGVMDWYADGAGVVRMGVGASDDGRSQKLLYRTSNNDSFKVIDRANSKKGQDLIMPFLFLPEDGQALAFDDHEGRTMLYKLDLKSMTLGNRVFGVDGYDVSGAVPNEAGTSVLGVKVTEDAEHMRWLDPELAAIQADLDKAVPGRRASIVSLDKARKHMIVMVDAANSPGAYYLFDRDRGSMTHLANVNQAIRQAKLNLVRTVHYAARDGLDISAVLTLPASRQATNLPVIVMPHGGPFARDSEDWDWWAQFLAERGYAVIQPNFRGSSGFGTEFAEKGRGQWGLAMQDDLDDALAYLAKQGIADPKRACIVGGSYGGYAAMRGAQRPNSGYRCAVAYAGVSDLQAMIRYDSGFLNSGRSTDWLRNQAPDLKSVSPINFAEQFSVPLLLMHGKADQRVPVKQSRELAEKLRKAGKTVRYVEQPLGDHHFSRSADRLQFLNELEAFLAKYNPA